MSRKPAAKATLSTIDADEALQLAKDYNQSANVVLDFRNNNWDTLSPEQRLVLGNLGGSLLDHSQDLITYAVGKILDDTQASLADIRQATADANQAIKAITAIKQVITIATALVTLAAAIYTENPSGIAAAVKGVVDAVNSGSSRGGNGNSGSGNAGN
jgi:hypothetical protein